MVSNQRLKSSIYRVLNPADHSSRISNAANSLIVVVVLVNLFAMALETDTFFSAQYGGLLLYLELFSVAFFTIEYFLRVWSINEGAVYSSRLAYIGSLDSLIDILAILPFYIGLFLDIDLRIFVTLRLFRLFKLFRYFSPLVVMANVMRAEARSFSAAMLVMFVLLFICATGIYFFESDVQPDKLGSIPQSMWWAIVTLTTLGYGDVIPITLGGRIFAGTMTIFAIGVVALPAGMLASRFSEELNKRKNEYREVLGDLVSDGSIDIHDQSKLLEIQQRLCLSDNDVMVLRDEALRSAQQNLSADQHHKNCPTCGQRVNR